MSARPRTALSGALALALACAAVGPTFAQQDAGGQSMTLEELEAFIDEQKQALEQAERNREITREKEAKVREELARREERRQALEDEVRALCEERAAVSTDGAAQDCDADPAG